MWHCLHACLDNSQQLLSSSDICSCVCLSKYTINAHNCMYACNYCQDISTLQESVQRYLGNGIISSIKGTCATGMQHYNYRFLHIGTKSTNAYHHRHPATVWCSPSYATNIEHSSVNVYLSAACNLHATSESHHHFKIYSLLRMVPSGIKRKQATK